MVEGDRLTAKQAEALRDELAELEGPRRAQAVAAIKTAREFGDLSENFEYHAAKNEQGLLEARIRTLRARLDHAEIVAEAGSDEVGVGSIVEIEGNGRTSSCRLRSSAMMSGGTMSGRVESSCPNLTNVGPSSSSISRRWRPRAVPPSASVAWPRRPSKT